MKKYFGNKKFYKTALIIIIPVVLQQVIISIAGYIDNTMINSYNPTNSQIPHAYNGVTAANKLMFFIYFLWIGTAGSLSIFISQYFGSKNRGKVNETIYLTLSITIIFGLLSGVTIYFIGPLVIRAFIPGDSLGQQYGIDYAKIMAYGATIILLNMLIANIFRSMKRTVVVLISGVSGIVFNVVFNYLLINGIWIFPELGAKGAAVATVLSKVLELVILIAIAIFYSKDKYIKDVFKKWHISKELFVSFLKKGIPIICNEVIWALGVILCVWLITRNSERWYTTYSYSQNVMDLFSIFYSGLATGTAVLVGSTLGEGNFDKAKDYANKLKGLSLIFSIIVIIFIVGLSPVILLIFKLDHRTYMDAYYLLLISAVAVPIYGYNALCYYILRAGGESVKAFLLDQIPAYLFGIPLLFLFSFMEPRWHIGLFWMFEISKATDYLKAFFSYYFVKKETWVKRFDHSKDNLTTIENEQV